MKKREKGAALILVIWCVLVLSVAILGASGLVEQGLSSQRLSSRRFDAKQAALTGIAYGRDAKIEKDDPLLFQELGPKRRLQVTIGSEGGRININSFLNRPDYTILAKLFEEWGLPEDEARGLVDCLRDWVDQGDLRSLNGAEARELAGTGYSLPENRPFLTVAEMRGVKGMDELERLRPDWAESFSVLSGAKLDVREASAELIVVFGKLTKQQAENVVAYRDGSDEEAHTEDDLEIKTLEQIATIAGLSGAQMQIFAQNFQVGGSPVRITSTGIADEVSYSIVAVVAKRDREAPLLWWEEK